MRSWLRRCGEGHKAHEAFECYRDLGGKRSIREVARRLGRWPSQIGGWSGKHQWVVRARAYDTSRERIQLEARELVEKQDAAKWTQRERERREALFQTAEKARAAADQMNQFPLTEIKWVVETDAEGRETQTQIIKPVGFTKRDVCLCYERWQAWSLAAIQNAGAVYTKMAGIDEWGTTVPFQTKRKNDEK